MIKTHELDQASTNHGMVSQTTEKALKTSDLKMYDQRISIIELKTFCTSYLKEDSYKIAFPYTWIPSMPEGHMCTHIERQCLPELQTTCWIWNSCIKTKGFLSKLSQTIQPSFGEHQRDRSKMVSSKVVYLLALALFGSAAAQPAKDAFWKGTPMDSMVEEMRSGCAEGSDPTACIKYKVMSLLDSIFKKDTFQVS